MESKLPIRKNLRIKQYDYNTPGAYFLTICTNGRKHILPHIVERDTEQPMPELTRCGSIVDAVIQKVPKSLGITVDRYVVMPNHIHLIAMITAEDREKGNDAHIKGRRSIVSKLVGYIKMNASKAIRQQYGDITVWQRGYHDHVIRNREDYEALAKYVYENPARWKLDSLYLEE